MLKKKTDEHDDLVKEVDLEKKETEDMLKQTAASVDATVEEDVRKVKAEAQERLAMETSQMDDYIRQLSRQRVAEDMLQVLDARSSSMLVSTVASIDATIEEVVRVHVIRARAKAQEQLAMKTSRRDNRITHLSRQ